MHINTRSREFMENSICDYLQVSTEALSNILSTAGLQAQTATCFYISQFDNVINEFINKNAPNKKIDRVLFFHLSRRLNTCENSHIGFNLYDLLTTKNAVTEFLGEHNVNFSPCDSRLDLFYQGELVSLEDTSKAGIPYLQQRLGHSKVRVDFCFNGFLLKDLLLRNNYARNLFQVPEFIGQLAVFLGCKAIGTDYYKNSRYYCFEYCVPIDKVLFDNDENLSNNDKPLYLLNRVFHRLYQYSVTNDRYMFDNDNPAIRLADNDTMLEEYFIAKDDIT